MTYPYTKIIIAEASEKYQAFANYYAYLEKKVDAFCLRKQEKKSLKEEISEELERTHKERFRLIVLEQRNKDVEPSSSRNAEQDHKEMKKIEKKLKPSEEKISGLFDKIEELGLDRDKKVLLEETNVCEGLLEDWIWTLVYADIIEKVQIAETRAFNQEFYKLSSEERAMFMIPTPENEEIWNSLSWKKVADKHFSECQRRYYAKMLKVED